MKKALLKISELLVKRVADAKDRVLIITHCNAAGRAETLKKMILDKTPVKNVIVMDTAGISSMYANDGGVIVTI